MDRRTLTLLACLNDRWFIRRGADVMDVGGEGQGLPTLTWSKVDVSYPSGTQPQSAGKSNRSLSYILLFTRMPHRK